MQLLDHNPIEVENLKGLFGRGEYEDTVPPDHLIESMNAITLGREIKTRDGFLQDITIPNVRRIWEYKRTGEASRLLVLNNIGQLYDTTLSLATPILTIAAMTDFSAISQFNRAYITPHNGNAGLPGEFVYVYNGSVVRKAGGDAPSTGFSVDNSINAGNVEAGTHILGVCYEYDSGYTSPPGQLRTILADGTKKLTCTSIPIGPVGVSARRIVMSHAIQAFNGDLEGYELFFVPEGRIADNSTTTLEINPYDGDLQLSCDYLFDQMTSIPSVLNLATFGSKMVYIATDTDKSMAYVSKNGEPESINAAAGFIVADPSETEGLKSGVEYRDSLYLTKGSKIYSTRDNGYDASTWTLVTLDKGIGADVFSLSTIQDRKGANQDYFIVGDHSGLYIFNGTIVRPELSYKILNWWERINKAAFNKVQIILDTKKFLIYCLVPLDSATSPSHIIIGDFTNGLDYENIRWHLWSFNALAFSPAAIAVGINNTTQRTYLRVGGYEGNIYNQGVGVLTDNLVAIDCYIRLGLLFEEVGFVHHYAGLELRINGSGSLQLNVRGEDNAVSSNLNNMPLVASSGKEYFRHANLVNEKCSVKLRVSNPNEHFNLKHLRLFVRPLARTRPS